MVSSSQIRERLSQFLDHQITLDVFEDWFIKNTWNIHVSGSSAAEDLTFAIEESLSEYSSGHISDEELRQELSELIHRDTKVVVFSEVPRMSWSITSVPAAAVFARA